jgi:hypothetical protein
MNQGDKHRDEGLVYTGDLGSYHHHLPFLSAQ